MLKYSQSQATWTDGDWISTGWYAGHGAGKNNPAMQNIHMIGPAPRGKYVLYAPKDYIGPGRVGMYAMFLWPCPGTDMVGRDPLSFYVHGDNVLHPGESSDGCIVGGHNERVRLWEQAQISGTTIEVVE